jgi:pyruvate formate lyase activating enzyme
MNLAGFVPLSLCDYPGRVAAVVFTQGCNFRCPWCHNGHLVPLAGDPSLRIGEEEVLSLLLERRNRVGSLVVTGGEPTLQLALPRFLRRVKALGVDVKLDTNGSHPDVVRQLLQERLLDYVAMDVKAPWDKYAALTGDACCNVAAVQASLALIAASGVPHAFRTTRVDPLLSEQEYGDIRTQIPHGSPHAWQAFRAAFSREPALMGAQTRGIRP